MGGTRVKNRSKTSKNRCSEMHSGSLPDGKKSILGPLGGQKSLQEPPTCLPHTLKLSLCRGKIRPKSTPAPRQVKNGRIWAKSEPIIRLKKHLPNDSERFEGSTAPLWTSKSPRDHPERFQRPRKRIFHPISAQTWSGIPQIGGYQGSKSVKIVKKSIF